MRCCSIGLREIWLEMLKISSEIHLFEISSYEINGKSFAANELSVRGLWCQPWSTWCLLIAWPLCYQVICSHGVGYARQPGPSLVWGHISLTHLVWLLTHCGLVTPYRNKIWVNIWLDNGLIRDSTKLLCWLIINVILTHYQRGLVTITWGQFHKRLLSHGWPK